jgi:hypothetical protein
MVFAHAALGQSRRATPHEAIERNLAPLTTAARELHLTDAERAQAADVFDRAEACAAEMVEAERHADHAAIRARTRRVELLVRLLRARVEALRAEAVAAERERAALSADERRTQARATLERAAERRIALERTDGVSAFTLPPPDPDAGARPAPEAPR